MPKTARRLVLITTASLTAVLTACTNPVAPSSADPAAPAVEQSTAGVYMGGVG